MSRMFYKFSCINPFPLEVATGIQLILLGLFLVLEHDETWNSALMGQMARPEVWGLALLALGSVQIASLRFRSAQLRLGVCVVVFFLYLFIDISLWLTSPSLAAVTLFVFAVLAGWSAAAYSARGKVNCGN